MFESLSHENEELKQRCRQGGQGGGGGGGVRAMPPPGSSSWQAPGHMGRSSTMRHAPPSAIHRDRELPSSRAPSRQANAALLDDGGGGGGAYHRNPPNNFGGGGGGGGGREFASHLLYNNDVRSLDVDPFIHHITQCWDRRPAL